MNVWWEWRRLNFHNPVFHQSSKIVLFKLYQDWLHAFFFFFFFAIDIDQSRLFLPFFKGSKLQSTSINMIPLLNK